MSDSRDELDPARLAAMRSLLVGHARGDAFRSRWAARRRRIVGASVTVGVLAALTAGVVTIAVTGLPIFGTPPATDVPQPTYTYTPSPTPTVPAPPTVQQFQAAVAAAGLDCTTWQPRIATTAPNATATPGTTGSSSAPSTAPPSTATPPSTGATLAADPTTAAGANGGGTCQTSGITYTTYTDQASVSAVLAQNAQSARPGYLLYGPLWIAAPSGRLANGDPLIALQSALGGTLSWNPTSPPAPVATTVVIGADDLIFQDDAGDVLERIPYDGDPAAAIAALSEVLGSPHMIHINQSKCSDDHDQAKWDDLQLDYDDAAMVSAPYHFTLSTITPSTSAVIETPNGARVGGLFSEYEPRVDGNASYTNSYDGNDYEIILDTASAQPLGIYPPGPPRDGVVVTASNGVISGIYAPASIDMDC
jgi:hypothetical protein